MTKQYRYEINYGAKKKMFTLWHLEPRRPDFIKNLSVDSDEAIRKAKEWIAENEPDNTNIDEDLDISWAELTLDQIHHRTQEEILQDSIARKEANIAKWVARSLIDIKSGYNPFDKRYNNLTHQSYIGRLDEMDQGTINYWANLTEFKSPVHEAMHEYCKEKGAVTLIKNANIHFGNVGDKKVRVKVQFVSVNTKTNIFSYYDHITVFRFHTEDGARIIFSTSSADAARNIEYPYQTEEDLGKQVKEGDWITIEGTIKEHINFEPKEYVKMETSGEQVLMPTGKVYKSTKMIRVKLIGENNDN